MQTVTVLSVVSIMGLSLGWAKRQSVSPLAQLPRWNSRHTWGRGERGALWQELSRNPPSPENHWCTFVTFKSAARCACIPPVCPCVAASVRERKRKRKRRKRSSAPWRLGSRTPEPRRWRGCPLGWGSFRDSKVSCMSRSRDRYLRPVPV